MGASRATILRIAGNMVLDAGLGAIPVIGDIFDFAWKANLKSVGLVRPHLASAERPAETDRSSIVLVVCGAAVLVLGLLALGILLTRWAFRALGAG